jgi:hypothetical protein
LMTAVGWWDRDDVERVVIHDGTVQALITTPTIVAVMAEMRRADQTAPRGYTFCTGGGCQRPSRTSRLGA